MRLSTRESVALLVGAVVVLGTGFWVGVWEPIQAHLALLDRRVAAKRTEHRQIGELAVRFEGLRGRIAGIEDDLRRHRDFSVLSYLEGLAKEARLQDRIVQMKPRAAEVTRYYRENAVEIRMEKVRLPDLVRYLDQVEHAKALLRIKQLQIRPRFDDPNLLDVRFQVSSYELLEAT